MIFRASESGPGGHPGVLPPQVGPDGEPIGGPRTPQQIAAQKRLQQTQAQVDEVNFTSKCFTAPLEARFINIITMSINYTTSNYQRD